MYKTNSSPFWRFSLLNSGKYANLAPVLQALLHGGQEKAEACSAFEDLAVTRTVQSSPANTLYIFAEGRKLLILSGNSRRTS